MLPALALITIAYTSCIVPSPVENCTQPQIDAFEFNATDTIRDDSVTLYRYTSGTGFAQHIHVFERRLGSGALTARLNMSGFVSPHTTDWKIVLHPSEKSYYIKDISFTTKKVKQGGHTTTCTDRVTYTVNDIPHQHIPNNPSPVAASGVILPIPY